MSERAAPFEKRARPSGWAWAAVVGALSVVGGCKGCGEDEGPAHGDVAWAPAACGAACASYVTAGCDRAGLRPSDQSACVGACTRAASRAERAGCSDALASYLDCLGKNRVSCAEARSSAAVCIEHGMGAAACADEHARFARCTAPCRKAGTAHQGTRGDGGLLFETVALGCADCPERPQRGAPPGSPCTSHSVCAQHCCSCDGAARYLARVCEAGRCAAAEQACSTLVREGLAACE